jgi:hypothetical protein
LASFHIRTSNRLRLSCRPASRLGATYDRRSKLRPSSPTYTVRRHRQRLRSATERHGPDEGSPHQAPMRFANTGPPQCLNGPGSPGVLSSAELVTGSDVGAGSDTDGTVGGMGAHCSPVAPAACRRPCVISEREHPGLPPTSGHHRDSGETELLCTVAHAPRGFSDAPYNVSCASPKRLPRGPYLPPHGLGGPCDAAAPVLSLGASSWTWPLPPPHHHHRRRRHLGFHRHPPRRRGRGT